jgi:hypothetical protein
MQGDNPADSLTRAGRQEIRARRIISHAGLESHDETLPDELAVAMSRALATNTAAGRAERSNAVC